MRHLIGWIALASLCACTPPPSDGSPDAMAQGAPPEARQGTLPDIVIVITDDQGWGDWEGSGNPLISTPAMMELAAQGATLTDFHVSPVCAPTRASLLTGRHALEVGVWGVTRGGERLRPDAVTIAENLKGLGYRTGMFGKWHSGDSAPYDPASQGFDRVFGFLAGHFTDYFDPVLLSDGEEVATRGYITTVVTDAALQWMREDSDTPTLTYVAYNTPHSPLEVPQSDLEPYLGTDLPLVTQTVYAMVTQLDAQLARLLDAADEDTIVIFLGDNGPAKPGGVERFNGGLNGTKGSVRFGGTLVPAIVRWPGVTTPGSVVEAPAQHIDLLPTLVTALGGTPAPEVDGVDIRAALQGDALPERTLFSHHTRTPTPDDPDIDPVQRSPGAARRGEFSAVFDPDGTWSLYRDRGQSKDVSTEHPEVLADLKAQYDAWFDAVSPGARDYLPNVASGSRLRLPAHNAYLSGDARYSEGWGWAQEWAVVEGEGAMRWPLRGDGGTYHLDILYGGGGGASVGGDTFDLPQAEAPNRFPGEGHRRTVATGEAISRDWTRLRLGTVTVPEAEGDWLLDLSGHLEVKGVELTPAEDGSRSSPPARR